MKSDPELVYGGFHIIPNKPLSPIHFLGIDITGDSGGRRRGLRPLSRSEWLILPRLISDSVAGKVTFRRRLLEIIEPYGSRDSEPVTIDSHIKRIRNKVRALFGEGAPLEDLAGHFSGSQIISSRYDRGYVMATNLPGLVRSMSDIPAGAPPIPEKIRAEIFRRRAEAGLPPRPTFVREATADEPALSHWAIN